MKTSYIGKPTSRVDGRAKVTGTAKYAGEFNAPGLAYGVVVSSAIAKGKIKAIHADEALSQPGVIKVFTHENAPGTAWLDRSYRDQVAPTGSPFRPLHDKEIKYSGQPIALVVAESFEVARYAASLVRVEYEREEHATELEAQRDEAFPPPKGKMGYIPPPKPRGDAEAALAKASARVDAKYNHPIEHHNPMEPHATTVLWEEGGSLTIHDKTQGVQNSQEYVCKVFGLSPDKVRVVTPFVGGAFGSGLRPQYQLFLAVLAARELQRSVRVTLTRQQMFTFGYRPATRQTLTLGADADGKLTAIVHEALGNTSRFEAYCENVVNWSGVLYQCENTKLDYKIARLDLYTPIDMRAPGAISGIYALECAMDELAYKVGVDPLELRLKNYAELDQDMKRPFSSKELRECYRQGAERFGWAARNREPRSMRDGDQLIGWGMATGIWEAQQAKSSARVILKADGKLQVDSGAGEIGPGTYTSMTQVAAETMGLPLSDVTFNLGDTSLPEATIQGGSMTAASVGTAVKAACELVKAKLFKLAQKMAASPLKGLKLEDVAFEEGQIRSLRDPSQAVSILEAMRSGNVDSIEEEATTGPNKAEQDKYTMNSHSAIFAEVKVDEALGVVTVTRVVTAVACGRILNPKTARSQVLGAVVGGIGMALEEESVIDQKLGRFMNHSLAEYHVPVNADVHAIDVLFVEEHDSIVNPLRIKGIGEIGIVGVAAAIANAVFHATGRRVRDLPITLDKLLHDTKVGVE